MLSRSFSNSVFLPGSQCLCSHASCSSPPQEPGPPRPPLPKSYVPLESPPTVPPLPGESRLWPYPTSPSWQQGGEAKRGQVPKPLQSSPAAAAPSSSSPRHQAGRGWDEAGDGAAHPLRGGGTWLGDSSTWLLPALSEGSNGQRPHSSLTVALLSPPGPLHPRIAPTVLAQDRDWLFLGSPRNCCSPQSCCSPPVSAPLLCSALASLAVLRGTAPRRAVLASSADGGDPPTPPTPAHPGKTQIWEFLVMPWPCSRWGKGPGLDTRRHKRPHSLGVRMRACGAWPSKAAAVLGREGLRTPA